MTSEVKRLYRSRDDYMICGVCGGLGQYFNVDSTLIRALFVVLCFFGPGIFIYLILWLIMPLESLDKEAVSPASDKSDVE